MLELKKKKRVGIRHLTRILIKVSKKAEMFAWLFSF